MDEGASQAERLCQVSLAGALAHLAALREGGSLAGTERLPGPSSCRAAVGAPHTHPDGPRWGTYLSRCG